MMKLFGCEIYKTPLQIQLFTTSRCNRKCEWCIEKNNMLIKYNQNNNKYIKNLRRLLLDLNKNKIPYNIVITGGEPTLNESLVLKILDVCKEIMPPTIKCYSSDNHKKTKAYKLGINSNGDNNSPIYKHDRLNYIDISFIDVMRNAKSYNKNKPIRLQTVYRKSVFGTGPESVIRFIDKAIKYNYDSILFRQLVGKHPDKNDIFELENAISKNKNFVYQDYQINVYDLWVKYKYKNHDIYFKRQDTNAQQLFERINHKNISSIVFWPNGKITKSWNYKNKLIINKE